MDENIFKDLVSMVRKIEELKARKETLQTGTAEFSRVQDELDAGYHRLTLKNMALSELAST